MSSGVERVEGRTGENVTTVSPWPLTVYEALPSQITARLEASLMVMRAVPRRVRSVMLRRVEAMLLLSPRRRKRGSAGVMLNSRVTVTVVSLCAQFIVLVNRNERTFHRVRLSGTVNSMVRSPLSSVRSVGEKKAVSAKLVRGLTVSAVLPALSATSFNMVPAFVRELASFLLRSPMGCASLALISASESVMNRLGIARMSLVPSGCSASSP